MTDTLYLENECYYISQNERKDRIPVYRGCLDIYIEKWTDGNGKYLDLAYTKLDLEIGLYYIRKAHFERHRFNGCFLVSFTCPSEVFDELTPIEEVEIVLKEGEAE